MRGEDDADGMEIVVEGRTRLLVPTFTHANPVGAPRLANKNHLYFVRLKGNSATTHRRLLIYTASVLAQGFLATPLKPCLTL